MKKAICPITKKVFDCLDCRAIVDGERCRYWAKDDEATKDFRFVRKVLEKEMNEK